MKSVCSQLSVDPAAPGIRKGVEVRNPCNHSTSLERRCRLQDWCSTCVYIGIALLYPSIPHGAARKLQSAKSHINPPNTTFYFGGCAFLAFHASLTSFHRFISSSCPAPSSILSMTELLIWFASFLSILNRINRHLFSSKRHSTISSYLAARPSPLPQIRHLLIDC